MPASFSHESVTDRRARSGTSAVYTRHNRARRSCSKIVVGLPATRAVVSARRAKFSETLDVPLENFAVAIAQLAVIYHLLYGPDRIVEFMTIEATRVPGALKFPEFFPGLVESFYFAVVPVAVGLGVPQVRLDPFKRRSASTIVRSVPAISAVVAIIAIIVAITAGAINLRLCGERREQ